MSVEGNVWQIDIQKVFAGEFWTNVYHCQVGSQAAAKAIAEQIILAESNYSHSGVSFNKYRIARSPRLGQQGTVYQSAEVGKAGSWQVLPLFNIAMVVFTVEQGRPSRKYLKLPFSTQSISDSRLTTSVIQSINVGYCQVLSAIPELCDESGNSFFSIGVSPVPGMRQLRRGSKRKLQPII